MPQEPDVQELHLPNFTLVVCAYDGEKMRAATILYADCFFPACTNVWLVLCLGAHVAHMPPFFGGQGARDLG